MRPLRLSATDFGSYRILELDMSQVRLAAIVGENGAGKSTVLEAIRVALFGNAAGTLDGFIRQGANGFRVVFEFETPTGTYRVVREAGSRGQKASLSKDDAPACEAKVREVDAKIAEVIGADYQTFTLAHHLPQGALTKFATLDPAERKSWLAAHLPLQRYAELEERAKALARGEEATRTEDEGRLAVYREQAAGVEEAKAAIDEAERAQQGAAARAEQAKAAYEAAKQHEEHGQQLKDALTQADAEAGTAAARESDRLSAVEHADRKVAALEARITEEPERGEADIEALSETRAGLQHKRNGILEKAVDHREAVLNAENAVRLAEQESTAAAKERVRIKAAWDQAQAMLVQAQDALEKAKTEHIECPRCGAVPEHQNPQVVLASHQAAVADWQASVLEATTALEQAEHHLQEAHHKAKTEAGTLMGLRTTPLEDPAQLTAKLKEVEDQIDAHHHSAVAVAAYRAALESVDEARAEAAEARQALEAAQRALSGAKVAQAAAREAYAPFSSVAQTVADARASYDTAKDAAMQAEATLDRAVRELKAKLEAKAQAARVEGSLADSRRRQADLELLAKAYGKSGIQARLLEEAVAVIEDQANAFLARFTDGMTVELRTQKENKTGGTIRETLDILVSDTQGTRALERFSGGETTRVCFALAAGLSAFVQSHSEVPAASFAVDEPEYLDPAGVAELVRCLHMMAESVPCVLLISHIEGVADQLPQRIIVTKDSDGSRAEVVT